MPQKVNVFGGPTIPQPLVQELPQEAAWAEWTQAVQSHEAKFAPTAPASIPGPLTAQPDQPLTLEDMPPLQSGAAKPPEFSLHDVLQEAKRDNRICPQPGPWTKLYVLLAQHRHGSARLPPPPLLGPAWDKTPALAKRMSLHGHLEWASMHGCLKEAFEFLKALPEDQWHYAN